MRVRVTSYTYFNLSEANVRTTYCPAIGKRGVYTIPTAGCGVGFTEEFLMLEGFAFGCAEIDMALSITCSGFGSAKFLVKDISLGGWASMDFMLIFTTTSKSIDLCLSFDALAFECIILEVGFGSTGYVTSTPPVIGDITINGIGLVYSWNGITFKSYTEFSAYSTLFSPYLSYLGVHDWNYVVGDTTTCFFVPWAGVATCTAGSAKQCCDGTATEASCTYLNVGDGFFGLECVSLYRYKLWEMFEIDIDADACCGGLFSANVKTYFGDKQELDYFAYAVQAKGASAVGTPTYLYGTTGASFSASSTGALCHDYVQVDYDYKAATGSTLFNWALTEATFGIGLGTNFTLNLGFEISAFGWESFEIGFEFEW